MEWGVVDCKTENIYSYNLTFYRKSCWPVFYFIFFFENQTPSCLLSLKYLPQARSKTISSYRIVLIHLYSQAHIICQLALTIESIPIWSRLKNSKEICAHLMNTVSLSLSKPFTSGFEVQILVWRRERFISKLVIFPSVVYSCQHSDQKTLEDERWQFITAAWDKI